MEITYGRFNYFPYESSWAVFVKAAALNLVSPSRLIASLSRVPVARYWMSDDLHIKNMADALGLPQAAVDQHALHRIRMSIFVTVGGVSRLDTIRCIFCCICCSAVLGMMNR